jgi:catechol 2,3-dioxygenase-like lactoylglutathione lyase family enzyme
MISRLSHATILVLNQDEARRFYTEKLGFDVRTDMTMDGFRWLTVGPKSQPDFELVLMEPQPWDRLNEEGAAALRKLVQSGVLGGGVFETDDCRGTYEELKAKGVEFLSEPEEKPYGIEAMFQDNSGNLFSLTQH